MLYRDYLRVGSPTDKGPLQRDYWGPSGGYTRGFGFFVHSRVVMSLTNLQMQNNGAVYLPRVAVRLEAKIPV